MTRDKSYTLYAIRCQKANAGYAGITWRAPYLRRFQEHIYHLCKNTHVSEDLQADWNKYGRKEFEFISIKENLHASEAYDLENKLMHEFASAGRCYNYIRGVVGRMREGSLVILNENN